MRYVKKVAVAYDVTKKIAQGYQGGVAPVRFLKYTPWTTIFSKNIAYIPNLTVVTEFWSNLPDYIRGLGVAMGRISRFPVDLRRRPYNSYNTRALPCECVIIWFLEHVCDLRYKVQNCQDSPLDDKEQLSIRRNAIAFNNSLVVADIVNVHVNTACHNFTESVIGKTMIITAQSICWYVNLYLFYLRMYCQL